MVASRHGYGPLRRKSSRDLNRLYGIAFFRMLVIGVPFVGFTPGFMLQNVAQISPNIELKGCVSTVIPVYNRAVFLQAAAKSVLAQTYRPIELVLVDDGSTDATADEIAKIVASHPDHVHSIRIRNSGPGGAREQGRLIARGEFIQYLDSDDELLPRKFELQVQALRERPDCGVAYGKTRLVDTGGKVLKAPFKSSGVAMEYLFPALLVDRWWNTLTPLYRRSVCDEVGPWPEMWMAEDWLYDARVGALKTKLVYVDEFVCDYRTHSGDRLTGSGRLSTRALANFCQLIPRLFDCALRAGVPLDCPEMSHFSRWAFSLTRQAAIEGLTEDADRCLQTALKATGQGQGRDIRAFHALARITGLKSASVLVDCFRAFLGKSPGKATMKQSWME
jgi:glycosyltransferase involved in cell wall biosynthesis